MSLSTGTKVVLGIGGTIGALWAFGHYVAPQAATDRTAPYVTAIQCRERDHNHVDGRFHTRFGQRLFLGSSKRKLNDLWHRYAGCRVVLFEDRKMIKKGSARRTLRRGKH